jgi:hypothetical protein
VISLFGWIEGTAMSVWVRESTSVLAFPAILCAHAIGMGLAAGFNAILALRLLGAAESIPRAELRRFVPVMWFGFWLNAVSGILLLIAYPTKALTNPLFYLKLSLIGLGMGLFVILERRVLEQPSSRVEPAAPSGRRLALVSLVCWAGAITSGRLLAYTYTRLMADWL